MSSIKFWKNKNTILFYTFSLRPHGGAASQLVFRAQWMPWQSLFVFLWAHNHHLSLVWVSAQWLVKGHTWLILHCSTCAVAVPSPSVKPSPSTTIFKSWNGFRTARSHAININDPRCFPVPVSSPGPGTEHTSSWLKDAPGDFKRGTWQNKYPLTLIRKTATLHASEPIKQSNKVCFLFAVEVKWPFNAQHVWNSWMINRYYLFTTLRFHYACWQKCVTYFLFQSFISANIQ